MCCVGLVRVLLIVVIFYFDDALFMVFYFVYFDVLWCLCVM